MGDVINFNQARKSRDKQTRERQATVNRARFGRDKPDRQRSVDEQKKLSRDLDGKALSRPADEGPSNDSAADERDPKS